MIDYHRWAAAICVFSLVNCAITVFAPTVANDVPFQMRLLQVVVLIAGLAVATCVGYVRREFFDITENSIAHRHYPLFDAQKVTSVSLVDAKFRFVGQRLRIEGPTSLVWIPLNRLDRPLEFLRVLKRALVCAREVT